MAQPESVLFASARGTQEDFSIPVDYNEPTAVDPPPEIFGSQGAVDTFLAQNSALAVKHLDSAYNAIMPLVFHSIDINAAAGIHRPQGSSGGTVLRLEKKNMLGGTIRINGDPSYLTVDPGGVITAFQLTDEVDGAPGNDPWVEVSGAGWTPGAFEGKFAILSTGQIAVIRDNTIDKLKLIQTPSPAPVVSVDSVFIGTPSTVLRNSLDDLVRHGTGHWLLVRPLGGTVLIADFSIQSFGASFSSINCFAQDSARARFNRCHIDREAERIAFGVVPVGFGVVLIGSDTGHVLDSCSLFLDPSTASSWETVFLSSGSASIENSLISGGNAPGFRLSSFSSRSTGTLRNTTIRRCGSASESSVTVETADLSIERIAGVVGRMPRIADHNHAASPALAWSDRAATRRTDVQACYFENNPGDCVSVADSVAIDHALTGSNSKEGWHDGGGNAGVGLRVTGSGSRVNLDQYSDVAGAAGEVVVDGVSALHSELPVRADLVVTNKQNSVTHE